MMHAVTVGQGQPQRLPTESEGLMRDRGSLSASWYRTSFRVGGKNTERLILLACLLACLHESPWRDPREEQGFKSCGEDREA